MVKTDDHARNVQRTVAFTSSPLSIFRLLEVNALALRFHPGLSAHLYRVPGTTHRRRIAQVEGIQVVDAHAMKEGRGEDINAFGDFSVVVSHHLRPQEA